MPVERGNCRSCFYFFHFIASYDHLGNNTTTYGNATWKVDSRKEAADLFIMNHTAKGDITVTQDIGLFNSVDCTKFIKELTKILSKYAGI